MGQGGRLSSRLGAAGLVAAAALSVWQGTLDRQAQAAHVCVIAAEVVVLAVAVVAGVRRQQRTSARWLADAWHSARRAGDRPRYAAGVAVWALLLGAVVAWDLVSFVAQAHDLPTLSREVGRLSHFGWGRALLFFGWLVLGAAFALARRRPSSRPSTEAGPSR